ncbi:hypothetical protein C8Q75DRAFT_709520 [Abortiporus biennis]|nr:hypothetical protein C8Q75DRAFT_709520 [Abortiporus biennis]
MDVISALPPSTLSERAPAPGTIPDFQAVQASFQQDHGMNGLESMEPTHQILSSPSATTASTNASHASSPALNGMSGGFIMGTSSLASALDDMGASRSRSGSSASPGLLASGSSDLTFSSGGSGPPTADSSFSYPAGNVYDHTFAARREDSPEEPGGAHLMVLGDMLKNIAQTANSGSQACTNGHTTNAREIVGLLKKNVLLVAELVAAMQLGDSSSPPSNVTSSSNALPPGSISNVSTGLNPQQLLNPPPPFSTTPPSISSEQSSMGDLSDMSRKRCASSVAGDRVVKAMKLEPQDDVSLQNPPGVAPPPVLPPPPLQAVLPAPVPSFPFTTASGLSHSIATTVESATAPPSVPSSLPASRPPSPNRVAHALLQDSLSSAPLRSNLQFPLSDSVSPLSLQQTDFGNVPPAPATVPAAFAPAGMSGSGWPTTEVRPTISRHSHSLSGNAVLTNVIPGPSTMSYTNSAPVFSPTRTTQPPITVPSSAPVVPGPAIGSIRTSRSSSLSHPNPFAFTTPDISSVAVYEAMQSRPSTSGLHSSTRPPSPDYNWDDYENDSDEVQNGSPGYWSSPQDDSKGENMEGVQSTSGGRRGSRTSPSADNDRPTTHANEVPTEYRAEVERIFFDFLNSTCSNLDATDAKGEPIHQTLMAKKMQRLDESPDFRPFKFRIQAFTNAFLEELARQGYPEEKIPMKKIRNFLWNQPYISRFNEEGKKSKSKGNHIWHVDAKKSEGGWVFRPFQRRLAGAPPGVAYVGLRWSWTPRIWDPQASRSNMPVTYSSQNLPSWLSWKDDVLSGIPPPEAQSCDVTVEARFVHDGKEEVLTHTVHISIAPMAAVDPSFTPSRRPSLVGDLNPRRVMSDSALQQTTPPRPLRVQSALNSVPAVVAPDSQVVQVLTTAAQRVAQEAQSQVVASPNDSGPELQALAKQQHVLTITAQAFNNKHPDGSDSSTTQSHALAAAAQLVVLQAARQVAADRTVAAVTSGIPPEQTPTPQVTVKEVSVATQSAVAQAVEMVGPLSSEVDVLMTAKSLLQQQTQSIQSSPMAVDPSQMAAPLDPVRPHSTGTLLQPSFPTLPVPSNVGMASSNGFYAP